MVQWSRTAFTGTCAPESVPCTKRGSAGRGTWCVRPESVLQASLSPVTDAQVEVKETEVKRAHDLLASERMHGCSALVSATARLRSPGKRRSEGRVSGEALLRCAEKQVTVSRCGCCGRCRRDRLNSTPPPVPGAGARRQWGETRIAPVRRLRLPTRTTSWSSSVPSAWGL